MIQRLPGWSRSEHDSVITMIHRDGPARGVVRYRERVRPMWTIEEQVAAVLATPELVDARPDRIDHFATREGELAAICVVHARCDDSPIAIIVGTIAGDDYHAALSATTTLPASVDELVGIVRLLLETDTHALGARRRSVPHVGPLQWTRSVHGLVSDWTTNGAALRVFPAEPTSGETDPLGTLVDATAARGHEVVAIDEPCDLASSGRETWIVWRITTRRADGSEIRTDLAVLRDRSYEYAVILESNSETEQARHRDALRGVLASITPFAPIHHHAAAIVAAVSHWAS